MKKYKGFIALLLCALMLFSLCACAAAPAEIQPDDTPQEEKTAPIMQYQAQFSTLSENSEHYLGLRAPAEGGYYAVDYAVDSVPLPDGGTAENYVTAIYFVSFAGGVERLENYSAVSAPAELAALPDFYSSHELLGLCADGEGSLISLESLYMSWYGGSGKREYAYGTAFDEHERHIYIRRLDESGAQLSCVRLKLDEDENVYANELMLDSEKRLILTEQSRLRYFTQDGEAAAELDLGGYIRSLLTTPDGGIAAICYGESGQELIHYISPGEPRIEKSYFVPGGMLHFALGENGLIYYTDAHSFYSYDAVSGESCELFNWLSCGVDCGGISAPRILPDGSVQCVSNSYDMAGRSYKTELITVSLSESSREKSVLRLGSLSPDNELITNIIAFNRENPDCSIELVDYSRLYDFSADGQQGRIMAELLSGNMPDILELEGLEMQLLASRGLLEDLYPYMDADAKLSRQDFFPAVLSACEYEGRLYAASPGFSVDTVLSPAALTGEATGWSYEQFDAALSSMGPDCQPYEVYTTSEDVLRAGLAMNVGDYVNWSELSADFENESFISLLEHAGKFPDNFDWDNYQWSDADIIENRLAWGTQMLLRTSLYGEEEIAYNSIYFKGDSSYIGYPSHDGSCGSVLDVEMGFGMSKSCRDKTAAWEFIKCYLEKDFQRGRWGFPSDRSLFLEELEAAMEPDYLTDETGEMVLTEDGQQIELSQGNVGTVLGVRGIYSVSEAQARRLTELLDSCNKVKCENRELIDTVVEVSKLYFDAQRGAKATAALVEDAVEQYLQRYR